MKKKTRFIAAALALLMLTGCGSKKNPDQSTPSSGSAGQSTSSSQEQSHILPDLPREFSFSSGAGAWRTVLYLEDDFSFTGEFRDSDMGGSAYPNGVLYLCNFSGRFSQPVWVDEYTWSMKLESIEMERTPDEEEVVDDTLIIYSEPYGLDGAEEVLIYLPGITKEAAHQGFVDWTSYSWDGDTLRDFGLYNVNSHQGFVAFTGWDEPDQGVVTDPETGEPDQSLPTDPETSEPSQSVPIDPETGEPDQSAPTDPETEEPDQSTSTDPEESKPTQGGTSAGSADRPAQLSKLPQEFIYSSEAGAWATVLYLEDDFSFAGAYGSMERGETGENYPQGTRYLSEFYGQFGQPKQVNEYTWTMTVESLQTNREAGEESIKDGLRTVYTLPQGLEKAKTVTIYLPGLPMEEAPEDFITWTQGQWDENTKTFSGYGLYSAQDQSGFVGGH